MIDSAFIDSPEDGGKEAAEERLLSDYRKTFLTTPHGWRVLQDLFGRVGLLRSTFTGNSKGYYDEGRRSVGIDILRVLEMDSTPGMMRAAFAGLVHEPEARAYMAEDLKVVIEKLSKEQVVNG